MDEPAIKVNLHTHSSRSDGELAPEALAARLAGLGLSYAALTDHDTISGSAAFRDALARHGVGCIEGVELTVETRAGSAHLLAYGFDPADPGLCALLPRQPLQDARAVGRNGPRQSGLPSAAHAIDVVHRAGGAVFLAHPLHFIQDFAELDGMVGELKAMGLDGLEAIYAGYDEAAKLKLMALADAHGLAVSAGGDFHETGAEGQSDSMDMPGARWPAFRESILRRAGRPLREKTLAVAPRPARGGKIPLPAKLVARIVIPALTVLTLFIASFFIIIVPHDENLIFNRKKETIRELTESAVSLLMEYETLTRDGSMEPETAKREAARRIRDMRYGAENKDYFWITDSLPRMVMHPYRPELEGQDLRGFRDAQGSAVFVKFAEAVAIKDEGYVEYFWQWEDDASRIIPKLSYVRIFRPWGWIIGTGIYIDDLKAEIQGLSADIILLGIGISVILALLVAYMARESVKIERGKLSAQQALRESRERYRALAEGSTDGTVIIMGGACIFSNGAFQSMTGYSDRETQLFRVHELLECDEGLLSEDGFADGTAMQCRLVGRQGQKRPVLVSGTAITIGDKQGAVLSVKEAPPLLEGMHGDSLPPLEEAARAFPGSTGELDGMWLCAPALDLAREVPCCRADASLSDIALRMAEYDADSAIILDGSGNPVGSLSSADIARVPIAAAGAQACGVSSILRSPIASIESGSSILAALAAMRRAGTDRITLRARDGSIRGMLMAADVALARGHSLYALREEAGAAVSFSALAQVSAPSLELMERLAHAGARARYLLLALSGIRDAQAQSSANVALARLGRAPAQWAFLSLGSMGRQEQLPGSDQDNALVWKHENGDLETERGFFLSLGKSICAGLEKAGMPRCPGHVMASMPEWNAPLHEWAERLRRGIGEPTPEKLLEVEILLDFRVSAGSSESMGIFERLRSMALGCFSDTPGFLLQLAADLRLRKKPGGKFKTAQDADLKELGSALSGFTRLYALKAGIPYTNTFDRLDALEESGTLKAEARQRLQEAYEDLLDMRLSRAWGPGNAPLSPRQESLLSNIVEQAIVLQKRIGFDFLGSGI